MFFFNCSIHVKLIDQTLYTSHLYICIYIYLFLFCFYFFFLLQETYIEMLVWRSAFKTLCFESCNFCSLIILFKMYIQLFCKTILTISLNIYVYIFCFLFWMCVVCGVVCLLRSTRETCFSSVFNLLSKPNSSGNEIINRCIIIITIGWQFVHFTLTWQFQAPSNRN